LLPVLKGIWFLFTAPALRRHRSRAFAVTGGVLALVLGTLLAMPLPYNTVAQGVVMPPPQAYANSGAEGVVEEVYVSAGQRVHAGDPLMRIEDPLLNARRALTVARIAEIKRRLSAQALIEQTRLRILRDELEAAEADLELTDARIAEQILRAGVDGEVILPVSADLVGRFVKRGDLLAVVATFEDPVIRVLVPEDAADLVRNETDGVQVLLDTDVTTAHLAHVVRAAPSLTRHLPSLALATEGGGRIALDPAQPREKMQAIGAYYQLDLALTSSTGVSVYGDRAMVRFSHGTTPLAGRIYRTATRVFLRYFAARKAA